MGKGQFREESAGPAFARSLCGPYLAAFAAGFSRRIRRARSSHSLALLRS